MCRKILTHRMHHDVRTPMIFDIRDQNVDKQPIYANPRRTKYHRCEVSRPKPGEWLLNSRWPTEVTHGDPAEFPGWGIEAVTHFDRYAEEELESSECEYHSCCVLSVDVQFCLEFRRLVSHELRTGPVGFSASDHEPEECQAFILEHRHKRLRYFGRHQAYPRRCPATWRSDMREVETGLPFWSQDYKREARHFADWQLFAFGQYEDLYRLEQDAKTLFLVFCDLLVSKRRGHPDSVAAENSISRLQDELTELRIKIDRLNNWAHDIDPEVPPTFIPIWKWRVLAAKDEVTRLRKVEMNPKEFKSVYELLTLTFPQLQK
ncbi:hypothetical protein F4677DRAFT_441565 [Hypoxylon crocopeplum]|nr:hypothetical protein F4677DRAFT_441565 [Hypoxylon crocopeplum]